ncbi:hypothetical protein AB0L57_30075 [Nocardia sp. NPDC052254]|uniref:hypothetical protein n=1 Tax=Nocardia sp. NPDC052254 TaxID=3155681 RepID=UPI0034360A73
MYPERESPYWKTIVGENWPNIPPRAWRDLATRARDGADALDPAEADRARRAFDELVHSSAGLQPVKDDLLAHQGTTRGFVDALVAAADTFGHAAALVDRTRDRILNIVDGALRDIGRVNAEPDDEDGPTAAERRDRIMGILARARAEVDQVARAALGEVGPQGFPELAAIAAALGQPGPWRRRPTGAGGAGGPGTRPGRAGNRDRFGPQVPPGFRTLPHGLRLPPGTFVPGAPALQDLRDLFRNLLPGLPVSQLPGFDLLGPEAGGALEHGDPAMADAPAVAAPPVQGRPAPGQLTEPGYAPQIGQMDGGAPATPMAATDTADAPAATHEYARTSSSQDDSEHDPITASPSDDGLVGDRTETTTMAAHSGDERHHDDESGPESDLRTDLFPGAVGTTAFGAAAGAAAQSAMFMPQQLPPAAAPPAGASAPPGSASPPDPRAAPGFDSRAPVVAPRVSAPTGGPAVGGPGVSAPGVSVPPPAAAGKGEPPARPPGDPVAATGSDQNAGSGEMMRDAVGAAMFASAAPTFMLGKRVDGDLVLARSILASLLAASEAATVGAGWAVSVMRHDADLTAFVTSNDGRGWLPPEVFLPREMSTPWVWSVAEGPGWEGFADPARVLAEFAVAWGRRTGARLSALVSSDPFDEILAGQLGEVALEGGVEPCAHMDFATAAPGLADRLELVSAAPVLERVAAVAPDRLGSRGLDFAYDAHRRLAGAAANPFASLGTGELRDRILQTILRGGPVQAQWWEELRDADTLLSASMLPLHIDVSRVPLGELRADAPVGRSAGEAATLRRLVAERRCDELVLLLSGEPSRQRLRDIVYAHGQVSEYLASLPSGPSTPEPARRPRITAGPNG